ncbi:MAG: MBG domain-containing protein, partial [Bacteroidota bacterium]|nr:MBG domain-containing protein [Bacteroidota bacterium]
QKAATVIADAKAKTYGDDNPSLTAVVSGTVNGDNLNYTLGTIAEKFSNVGAYPISITLGSNPNYIVTPTDALLTVGPKAISVTVDDGQTKLYGNNDPVLTYQITSGSLVNGDALNGQLGRDGGENVGSYPINQGALANSNYNITFTKANFTITPRSVMVTPNSGQSKKYGSSDPVLLYGTNPASLPNGSTVNLNGSLIRSSGENVGNYSILQNNIVTANNPNYIITFTDGIMFAITPSSVTATVTMNKDSVQYSDVAVFTATIAGGAPLLSGGPQAATSATFYVGTQSMGPANLTVNGKDLVATLSATLLETIADQMMPGSKTLRVNFNGINSNYDVPASVTSNVMLARENAIVNYSGVQFASTSGISSSTAIVTLAATIQDITAIIDNPKYDAYPGDIRKAKVRFMNMDSNTPITDWLPVALINSTDLKTGTVMFDWTTNIGSNDALQFTLGVQVDGYYVGTSDNTIVTVAKPLDNFVTGGGNLLLTNAVSGTKDGDIGSKLNFGFNVKYDAAKNELKGHFNAIIFRTEDQWGHKCMPNHGMLHQFKIDGDDMISLAVVPATATSPATATFTGKLDVRDNQHSNILFANGATVMVTMTDYGQPGKNDRLGITVWNTDGSLLFSSNWGLIRTAEQKLNDGNLEIHSKVVFKTGSIQPTVTLLATPTSGVKGTPITFNVTVKGSKNMPTGSVTFKDNTTGTVLTTVLLSNGTATFTTSSLGVGTHNVDAYYGGNNTYSSADDDAMIEITMPLNSSALNSEHPDPIELNVYPNPFGSHLFFKLQTPEDAHVLLEIFDISGRKIAVAFDQVVSGNQLYAIDYAPAGNVAPGLLIYRLTVGQKIDMGKVIYQPR